MELVSYSRGSSQRFEIIEIIVRKFTSHTTYKARRSIGGLFSFCRDVKIRVVWSIFNIPHIPRQSIGH